MAKNLALSEYLHISRCLARKVYRRCPKFIELKDLESAAALGLMEALAAYEEDREETFERYARKKMLYAVLDAVRSYDWMKTTARRFSNELKKEQEGLQSFLGRPASTAELRCHLKETGKFTRLKSALKTQGFKMLSTEDQQFIEPSFLSPVEEALEEDSLSGVLKECIRNLDARKKKVIELYFFKQKTLLDIGEKLRVTETRAGQLKNAALRDLKRALFLKMLGRPASFLELTRLRLDDLSEPHLRASWE